MRNLYMRHTVTGMVQIVQYKTRATLSEDSPMTFLRSLVLYAVQFAIGLSMILMDIVIH